MISFLPVPLILLCRVGFAQVSLSPETYQLQQLVESARQQLQITKELLKDGKQNAEFLEKSSHILTKLSEGIDRSIQKYQGTSTLEQALLKIQQDELKKKTLDGPAINHEKEEERFKEFQSQTIQANLSDLKDQQKLAEALRSAEQAFIPKLQSQGQIGSWQSNTRISSQLTELLSAMHQMREDLNRKNQSSELDVLLKSADFQNDKQRKVMTHGLQ